MLICFVINLCLSLEDKRSLILERWWNDGLLGIPEILQGVLCCASLQLSRLRSRILLEVARQGTGGSALRIDHVTSYALTWPKNGNVYVNRKIVNCKRSLLCLKPGHLRYGLDDRRSGFGFILADILLFRLTPRMTLRHVPPHIYCVAVSPHRTMRSAVEFDHTFPFSDDVNGWRCASTSLYLY